MQVQPMKAKPGRQLALFCLSIIHARSCCKECVCPDQHVCVGWNMTGSGGWIKNIEDEYRLEEEGEPDLFTRLGATCPDTHRRLGKALPRPFF